MPPPPVLPPPPPYEPPVWPIPSLRLRVDDLAHPGAQIFFQHVNPYNALTSAVLTVFDWLYTLETVPHEVETIVLVLRSMPGVAHTFGSDNYKEIHFSLDWIKQCEARAPHEINGVLVHEMVHCFQYNGKGKAPGGLIEGIADWIRLHAELAPPHWTEGKGTKWDAGYEATGFFLDFIEQTHERGFVRSLNLEMRNNKYKEEMFKKISGRGLSEWWTLYQAHLGKKIPNNDPEKTPGGGDDKKENINAVGDPDKK
ncbi:plant basic secretory protein [Abortiporus biennis]|nr:plant basic secretory protein [Abortiporus biennis]